jgi:hypothetical protein
MKVPHITAAYNVYVDGGTKLLGLADCTMPNWEALTETITGAGIMGELEIPSRGHMSALTFVMNFRSMLDDPLTFAISQAYHFDLRAAQGFEDNTTYERGEAKERYSIRGPIKTVNPGTRGPHAAWDATIEVAVRRVEHFIDGRQVLEFDLLNDVYRVNGVDIYQQVRAATS